MRGLVKFWLILGIVAVGLFILTVLTALYLLVLPFGLVMR